VRRVEALTGDAARAHLMSQDKRVRDVAAILKTSQTDVVARVEALVDERRRLERELADAKKRLAMGGGGKGESDIETFGAVAFMGKSLMGVAGKDLKSLADEGKKALTSGVVAIVGVDETGKAGIVVTLTDDLADRFNAVDLVRVGSEAVGGKGGGGRPTMAQAGGPDGAKADEALAAIRDKVAALAG
jgi:alanyl-tRNA synthetase